MARSSYYYHHKKSLLSDKYKEIKELINRIYHYHKGRYGYRRVTLEINKRGLLINHKTVLKLMRELGLKSLIRVKRYKSYKGQIGLTAPNILQRNFKTVKPNKKWATDITEFKVLGNKLYLSPIIDLFNGEIISYDLSEKPDFKQVVAMLKMSFKKISNHKNLILHSDQGWQYQMKQYRRLLQDKGIIQSMSRKDLRLRIKTVVFTIKSNAVIGTFFGILKSELFYLNKYESISQLKKDIKEYLEYYNNERIKKDLSGMSPIEYRTHYNQN
jgi:putative transposase